MNRLPPGPRNTVLATARYLRDPFGSLLRAADRFGDPYSWPTFLGKLVITGDPEGLKTLLSADPDIYEALGADLLGPVIGRNNLILLSGERHTAMRKMQNPQFHGARLRAYGQIITSVAETYVGGWMRELMTWLVVSSLFAGLLAFQNSASRYFYAMGRSGVLPASLERVNRRGAPWIATLTTSVITFAVIVLFAVTGRDPILNLFYWFSGMAVIAIVFVEILVSISVIAFFSRHQGQVSIWASLMAPLLSIGGLSVGLWLLASRFALLAGTVKEGVDPSTQPWGLNATGWALVIAPFVMFIIGTVVGKLRLSEENEDAVADLVT